MMAQSRAATWEAGELRVLVVDDERDVRLGLRLLAESLRADAREAASAEEALAICSTWTPHVVLSDVAMEGMSGMDLLGLLAARLPWARVVLITGFGTIELAVEAMRRGAAHFITKPFDNEEVLESMRRYGQEALIQERVRQQPQPEALARFVAEDPRTQAVLEMVRQVAPTSMPVLIQGESGTGKELVARAVHDLSAARDRPFLAVNSAALPDTLLESELFGHRKGAFTGADGDREGIFAQAGGGTVFLDEIALMSPAFQGKLLRVLQEKTVQPLGTAAPVPVDFRLLAATSRDLRALMAEDRFREDLYYRLRVVVVEIPPLRERPGDVVPLAEHFLAKYREQAGGGGREPRLSAAALDELRRHSWPGNVRELENCIQRALVLSRGGEILSSHLGLGDEWSPLGLPRPGDQSYEEGKQEVLRAFQRRFIERALADTEGNVTRAAEKCGLTRAAFQRIMRSLDLDRSRFSG